MTGLKLKEIAPRSFLWFLISPPVLVFPEECLRKAGILILWCFPVGGLSLHLVCNFTTGSNDLFACPMIPHQRKNQKPENREKNKEIFENRRNNRHFGRKFLSDFSSKEMMNIEIYFRPRVTSGDLEIKY